MNMKTRPLFINQGTDRARIPSVTVTPDGTVYAFTNCRVGTAIDHADETRLLVRRKKRNGDWEPVQTFGYPGWSWMIGACVCDENTGKVMCFFRKIAVTDGEFSKKYTPEERNRLAKEKEARDGEREGNYILESVGEGFSVRPVTVVPNPRAGADPGSFFATGSPHGCGSGITKRFGDHAGRLLVPARFLLHETAAWTDLATGTTNTVIFSDDHGNTWQTGGIVEPGTGEGALCERSDGSLYFNSRSYFGVSTRRDAISTDGGASFVRQRYCETLIEPNCNADLVRCDWNGKVYFLFSNPHSTSERVDMTISLSTDEGETWKPVLTVDHRKAGYSSLGYDRETGTVYLLWECGTETYIDENDILELPIWALPGTAE